MSSLSVMLAMFSMVSFLAYGVSCFISGHMQAEFDRYGLPRYRQFVGILQVTAAVGQLIGLRIPHIGLAASAGIAAMMLVGVAVRMRIHDSLVQTLPAASYALLNIVLVVAYARAT